MTGDLPHPQLKCPTCGKAVDRARLGQRGDPAPFCSTRCRDVDLGRWFNGVYQIPAKPDDDDLTSDR